MDLRLFTRPAAIGAHSATRPHPSGFPIIRMIRATTGDPDGNGHGRAQAGPSPVRKVGPGGLPSSGAVPCTRCSGSRPFRKGPANVSKSISVIAAKDAGDDMLKDVRPNP